MDALSHALIALILFSSPSLAPLIPFAVLGAVIVDADIFFPAVSDNNPSLYLFTHGGIAHSLAGAAAMSLLAYFAVIVIGLAGVMPAGVIAGAGIAGYTAILAGSLLHIAIDLPACPGIPLLAPFLDRKYTPGILPGPSIFLAFTAVIVAMATAMHLMPFGSILLLYGGTAIAYLAVRTCVFLFADARLPDRKVPKISPFRWMTIREDHNSVIITQYDLYRGITGESVFIRYNNTSPSEVEKVSRFTEVRRFLFNSYTVTAERIGAVLILSDPVRERGFLPYPFKFKRVAVTAPDQV